MGKQGKFWSMAEGIRELWRWLRFGRRRVKAITTIQRTLPSLKQATGEEAG